MPKKKTIRNATKPNRAPKRINRKQALRTAARPIKRQYAFRKKADTSRVGITASQRRASTASRKRVTKKGLKPLTILKSSSPDSTYNDALLESALSGSAGRSVDYNSILFGSALCSVSLGMRAAHYKSGFSVGKSLFKSFNSKNHYSLPEEGVCDLVRFMERVGYGAITYTAFSGKVHLAIHQRIRAPLGANVHSFESGMLAGFLSASRRQLVSVHEESCANNGSGSCNFSTSQLPWPKYAQPDATEVINKFMEHLERYMSSNDGAVLAIPEEYHALHTSQILESADPEALRSILAYAGEVLAAKAGIRRPSTGRIASSKLRHLEAAIDALNMGKPTIKGTKPIDADVAFGTLTSKRPYVDASIALLCGAIGTTARKGSHIDVTGVARNDAYKIKLTERMERD